MKIALVGNPNCGKTTLFNRMTGSKKPVGNRAGVTVEISKGKYKNDEIYDLPGIYSTERSANEESITASFLKKDIDYILNIVDARYLSRSLLLTSQLLKRGIRMTVVLNMTDKKSNKNFSVDTEKLSNILGCPVIILLRKDNTFDKLFLPSDPQKYNAFFIQNSKNFAAFDDIEKSVISGKISNDFSDKIDKILLNKFLAFPIFLIIMSGVLFISSGFFGSFLGKYINLGISLFSDFTREKLQNFPFLAALVSDEIIAGIGSVVSFLPLIVSLFFLLNLLEDCGYLSRIAVILDRAFAAVGASGRTAVSLILGCGCTVPAVMSTRTLDEKERKKCLSCVHFIPCSAKLPVLAVLLSVCFDKGYLLAPLFYIIGIAAVFISLFFAKKGDESSFLLEIPPLQLPDLKSVLGATKQKLSGFLTKICTVVFLSSVTVWFLQSFDFSLEFCTPDESILAKICGIIKYVFLPIGLCDWRITASFLAGFAGKESVIGVLSVLGDGDISSIFNGFSAFQYAVFLTLSPPCAASLAAMRKEQGNKNFFLCLLRQFLVAYIVCSLINLGFLLFFL